MTSQCHHVQKAFRFQFIISLIFIYAYSECGGSIMFCGLPSVRPSVLTPILRDVISLYLVEGF